MTWLVLTINWIGSLLAMYLYLTAENKSNKKLLIALAFAAWFMNAAYLTQQPFTLSGYLDEISRLICEDKGLATLNGIECKNEVAKTIYSRQ